MGGLDEKRAILVEGLYDEQEQGGMMMKRTLKRGLAREQR